MAKTTIKITVESVKGECPTGNKVGNTFIVENTTPAGMCLGAFSALLPAIMVMKNGGSFPWERNPDVAHVGCSDPINQVVYRIERIIEE